MKSTLFKIANKLRSKLGMSAALRKAWQIIKLWKLTQNLSKAFSFTKKDNTTRKAFGSIVDVKFASTGVQVLWFDEQNEGMKSFKAENLI